MLKDGIEKLRRTHDVDSFDCGSDELNRFLQIHGLQSQNSNASQSYVALYEGKVIGYYTLVVGEIDYFHAPDRLRKGLARHPIPIMILARLAVDRAMQKRGLGKTMLRDAVMRTMQAAEIAGIRALSVHAKDETVRTYYERFHFMPSTVDPLHLFVLLKDIKSEIEKALLSGDKT